MKSYHYVKIFFDLLRSRFYPAKEVLLTRANHNWDGFNEGAIGRPLYYLYSQALLAMPSQKDNWRALELGAGAGDVAIDLLGKGFEVTAIDSAHRSEEIIRERTKHFSNKFIFQRVDFQNLQINNRFDLIISLFSLPFLPKEKLSSLIVNLSQSMNKGAIFAFNLFANEHSWAKKGLASGFHKEELINLLQINNLEVDFFLNRIYDQPGKTGLVHWDIYDVIALKVR